MCVSVCANDAAEARAAVTSSSSCHISQQGTTVNEFPVAGYLTVRSSSYKASDCVLLRTLILQWISLCIQCTCCSVGLGATYVPLLFLLSNDIHESCDLFAVRCGQGGR